MSGKHMEEETRKNCKALGPTRAGGVNGDPLTSKELVP